jgi:tetratricopeptide (TPR) repeat protein
VVRLGAGIRPALWAAILAWVTICVNGWDGGVVIDYPLTSSVFPPEITAPVFLWHGGGSPWAVEFDFQDGAPPLRRESATPSWQPDETLWRQIQQRSSGVWANVTIGDQNSQASVRLQTSRDPVGAPIFYREVPLRPSEVEKGVIKPLAPAEIPLITWKLRDLAESESRVVLRGLHTCTNCHSFSKDGKTLGMDVDGPENDKGTYAIAPVGPRMTIANQDVITWNSFAGKQGRPTIGFLSQISPSGRYAITTLNEQVYVANFKDYRFLQVFYPTRGILAVYDRETGRIAALPGASDPNYVQTSAVWSPDEQYLVFQRARAEDAYPPGRKAAEYAGDPNELPIRYDLYRVPFRGGQGGVPEPVRGASENGMSNTFPKVSPDGRWIVFVKCRNGMLMRPDSELWIVPALGGEARRMRANTPLMNSWHSFSPNGRWLVFSSKSRTPYTRMFLTHIDEDGNDTPPILVENAAAADRAVNLPEFVNLPRNGLLSIDVPAAEFYRLFDNALELDRQGQHAAAAAEWEKALAIDRDNAKAQTNLGIALSGAGDASGAMAHFERAVELNPYYAEARNNLGAALVQSDKPEKAVTQFRMALEVNPDFVEARHNLALALIQAGKCADALPHLRQVLEATSANVELLNAAAWVLSSCPPVRDPAAAVRYAERARDLTAGDDASVWDALAAAYAAAGRYADAAESAKRALMLARRQGNAELAGQLEARIALYERHQ